MKKLLLFILVISCTKSVAKEGDLYNFMWLDQDKKVYVLQNKVYQKKRTTYMDIGCISNLTGKYQETNGVHFNIGHYLNEEWAIEIFYKQYFHQNNDTYNSVLKINATEPFVRRINQMYGALAVWSPFYGKINTFNHIFYFDWSFGVGPAILSAESNRKTVLDPASSGSYESEKYIGAQIKTTLKFHINSNWHLGINLSNTTFDAPGPIDNTKKLRHTRDAMLSIGFSF
ncbi:MAG: outer membrane beta-barrel domain-containing protein [Bacteriovoracaceae bacterium]|nr:outer membrane beta-barrel domain-containing protein [Bacteriovoracaceae bacterium]